MTFRWQTTLIYGHDLLHIPEVIPRVPIEVRTLSFAEVPRLHEVWPVNLAKMRERLRRGDLCFIALSSAHIVCYDWVQYHGWHYIQPAGRWRRIRAHEACIYHARTAEHARGNRIQPCVLTAILKHLRQNGFVKAWIYTTGDNVASQKAQQHAGFVLEETLTSLRIGSRIVIPWACGRTAGRQS